MATVLLGPVSFPVQASPGALAVNAAAAPATCQVLHLDLGAITFNTLGLQVTTQPIAIDLSGDAAGPLGNLVCTALETIGNAVGLVDLLNQILRLLTGLVGGIIPS